MRGQTFSSFRASPSLPLAVLSRQLHPANPQQSTGSRYRALPQYCYRKTLEKLREAPCFSAHGTCTVCDPCSLHCTRGTWHTIIVLNWQLSRCASAAPYTHGYAFDSGIQNRPTPYPYIVPLFLPPFRHLQPYCRHIPRVLQP